jgi:mitochondrial ATPase complex subunit ATP10
MRHHKGKSFIAPPRLFKSDKALYFPNMCGEVLVKKGGIHDTTPVLEGKISVVSIFSSVWAERQAASFVSERNNPDLHQVMKENNGLAQMVQINMEDNSMKAMMIRLFKWSLRKRIGEANWGQYFLVTRGITDEIKDAIGLLNSKVGYTYLLDGNCKIRWAGSGICEGDEKEGLVKGTRRLIKEAKEQMGEKASRDALGQIIGKSTATDTTSEKVVTGI